MLDQDAIEYLRAAGAIYVTIGMLAAALSVGICSCGTRSQTEPLRRLGAPVVVWGVLMMILKWPSYILFAYRFIRRG